MNAQILQEHLYHYFIQSRTLGLPGIGTFDLFRVSAQTDFANRRILAPGYTISYDSLNDAPDKDLFEYLSRKCSIPEWEAIKVVNDFSQEIKSKLRAGQDISWEGIGLLRSGSGGDIFFDPQPLQYAFIGPVNANRVVRHGMNHPMLVGDRQLGSQDMQDMLAGEDYYPVSDKGWWVPSAILAAIAILLIAARVVLGDQGLPTARMDAIHPATATDVHASPVTR